MSLRSKQKPVDRMIVGELSVIISTLFSRSSLLDDLKKNPKVEKVFIKDFTDLILDLIRTTVEETRNPITRNYSCMKTVDEYIEVFSEKHGFNSVELCTYLLESLSICQLFSDIDRFLSDNDFDIYEAKLVGPFFVLEYLGDYRIMEWEMDHMKGGKYVTKKR